MLTITLISLVTLINSRFFVIKNIKRSIKVLRTNTNAKVSSFGALTNALSATIGMGNIAGVAVAIDQGGAGSIFWMWVCSIFGVNLKFFETLAAMITRKNINGQYIGGAGVGLVNTKNKVLKKLGLLFSISGIIGTLAIFQANQLSAFLNESYGVNKLVLGIILFFAFFIMLKGGVESITKFTKKIVPIMCIFYICGCLLIIIINIGKLPATVSNIVLSAFSLKAAFGGFIGHSIISAMTAGFKRATFSNEAGLGTAPLAHIDSSETNPINESLSSSLGPVIDTLIICTLTGVTILISDAGILSTGINQVKAVYAYEFGSIGKHILGLSILMFSISTMAGMANYNYKCFSAVFGKRKNLHLFYYCLTLLIGSIFAPSIIVDLLDSAYALMLIPNLIFIIISWPKLKELVNNYEK